MCHMSSKHDVCTANSCRDVKGDILDAYFIGQKKKGENSGLEPSVW